MTLNGGASIARGADPITAFPIAIFLSATGGLNIAKSALVMYVFNFTFFPLLFLWPLFFAFYIFSGNLIACIMLGISSLQT